MLSLRFYLFARITFIEKDKSEGEIAFWYKIKVQKFPFYYCLRFLYFFLNQLSEEPCFPGTFVKIVPNFVDFHEYQIHALT